MEKFPITQKGYKKLEAEIKQLKYEERPSIIEAIATAREFGDLSENAEYHAAREKQSFVEGRILDLGGKFSRAEIIDTSKLSTDSVKFGATVKLIDDKTEEECTYHVVGEYEADITKKMISVRSPLARAIIAKSVGDVVEVSTPKGTKTYEILEITFQELDLD
ncbi:MAG: transcription elongation factor GreA [Rickettsiales bacterium]|nr:MAG: transcription elongation factor GreA [Rickettsiales bacterium]